MMANIDQSPEQAASLDVLDLLEDEVPVRTPVLRGIHSGEVSLAGGAAVNPGVPSFKVTKQHSKRLRFYWQGRGNDQTGRGDGIDLDLVSAGWLERKARPYGGVSFLVTGKGEAFLIAEKAREIERRQPHHEMAGRVAAWLRDQKRITWENIELLVDLDSGGRQAVRPDVYSLVATYDQKRLNPCVYEVKVSRADFLADVAKTEKRAGYANLAEIVYYVVPEGMIQPDEVPAGYGLIVEQKVGEFLIVMKPKRRNISLSPYIFMNLILKPGEFEPI